MMAVFLLMLQTAAPAPTALPPAAVIENHARRGVLVRLDGAAAQSVQACMLHTNDSSNRPQTEGSYYM